MFQNEDDFLPMSKYLYVDVAKLHNTTSRCVERDIRNVIELVWKQKSNENMIIRIFGFHHKDKKPSNMEFLMLLFNFMKYEYQDNKSNISNFIYQCPELGHNCKHCNEIISQLPNFMVL